MAEREIFVTELDRDRLQKLLDGVRRWDPRDRANLDRLQGELDRARIVPATEVPPDVVTMNSAVAVRDADAGTEMTFHLVFPAEADFDRNQISILAPVGMAVLGYRVGDTIEWPVPGGTKHLEIERVLYQPEAAGHFDR